MGHYFSSLAAVLICMASLNPAHADPSTGFSLNCNVQTGGNTLTANFNSSQPTLIVSDALNDGTHSVTTYLQPTSVCGVTLDFATNCTSSCAAGSAPNEAAYKFQCNNGISGGLTFDGQSSTTFSCSGPNVTTDYQQALFSGCTLSLPPASTPAK